MAQLERQTASVVLLGSFNPAIFHPSWFAKHNLVRAQEAEAATQQPGLLVHPEASVFEAEWLNIRVTRDRFQALTSQEPYYEPLRDLVVGVFSLLPHTPLTAIGLNRAFHYRVLSENEWNNLGHRLAPKPDWQGVLEKPGMLSLTMQGMRSDRFGGFVRVKVEPSMEFRPGVFVAINDHYELTSGGVGSSGGSAAIQILGELWRTSLGRSLAIAEKISRLGEDQ